jgi:hypothetical protein
MCGWSRRSATVNAATIAPGVCECVYGGLVTQAVQPAAHRATLGYMEGCCAAVIRTEPALFTIAELPAVYHDLYARVSAPAALVVPLDRFEFWSEWCELLARETGLVRAVFLQENLHLARAWAESVAERAKLHSSLPFPQQPYLFGRSSGQTTGRWIAPPS